MTKDKQKEIENQSRLTPLITIKVMLIFILLWALYIYLLGEVRFYKFLPENHWLAFIPSGLQNIGQTKIAHFTGLIMLAVKWGVFLPFGVSYFLTKKICDNKPFLYTLLAILGVSATIYFSILLVEITAIYIFNLAIFENSTRFKYLSFLANFDKFYILISLLGCLCATVELKLKKKRS